MAECAGRLLDCVCVWCATKACTPLSGGLGGTASQRCHIHSQSRVVRISTSMQWGPATGRQRRRLPRAMCREMGGLRPSCCVTAKTALCSTPVSQIQQPASEARPLIPLKLQASLSPRPCITPWGQLQAEVSRLQSAAPPCSKPHPQQLSPSSPACCLPLPLLVPLPLLLLPHLSPPNFPTWQCSVTWQIARLATCCQRINLTVRQVQVQVHQAGLCCKGSLVPQHSSTAQQGRPSHHHSPHRVLPSRLLTNGISLQTCISWHKAPSHPLPPPPSPPLLLPPVLHRPCRLHLPTTQMRPQVLLVAMCWCL